MPYYIFRVKPFAQLEKLEEHRVFRDASLRAKALRADQGRDAPPIKVIYAETQQQAEDLLCQVRDPAPLGDD
jgi:hypothetical protein